jgi:hypothetical protein
MTVSTKGCVAPVAGESLLGAIKASSLVTVFTMSHHESLALGLSIFLALGGTSRTLAGLAHLTPTRNSLAMEDLLNSVFTITLPGEATDSTVHGIAGVSESNQVAD